MRVYDLVGMPFDLSPGDIDPDGFTIVELDVNNNLEQQEWLVSDETDPAAIWLRNQQEEQK